MWFPSITSLDTFSILSLMHVFFVFHFQLVQIASVLSRQPLTSPKSTQAPSKSLKRDPRSHIHVSKDIRLEVGQVLGLTMINIRFKVGLSGVKKGKTDDNKFGYAINGKYLFMILVQERSSAPTHVCHP